MAAQTIVIDIVANFVNKTQAGMNSAKQSVDRFNQSIDKTKRKMDIIGGTNAKPRISVVDRATSTLTKVDNSLKAIGGKTVSAGVKILDYATKPLQAIKNSLFSIKGLIAAVGTGLAVNKLVAQPISLADSYTGAQIGFSTLLGKTGGQEMMDKIDQFAKETPFKTSGVINNVQKMMAMGWDVDRVIKDMETIGDAAAATGKGDEGLESIVYALSEIRSKGKLSTQELNQLASAGIKAKAYLAEGLGYGTSDKGMKKLAADLEDGAIGANKAIELILKGMEEFDGMMDKTANETVEGLWSQIEDTFEINIFRRWGQGLQDGAKRGFGSIVELLNTSEEGLAKFGDTVYEIGKELSNWAADKLEGTIDKVIEIMDREDFKNASLFGKAKILWDEVIAQPFSEWWDSTGKPFMARKMGELGEGLGSGMSKGIMALLGIDVIGATGEAASMGSSFADGFAKGFESRKVWDAIVDAAGRAFKSGFESLFTGSWLERIIMGGLALKLTSGILGTLTSIQTLWAGTGAVTSTGGLTLAGMGLKGMLGSTGNAMVNGSGVLGSLASLGYKVGGGSSAAMYFGANLAGTMSGGAAALTGLGTLAGGALTGYGLYSAGKDFYTGIKADDSTELGLAKKQAYTNSGALKASGIAAGAAIGSIIPGIGTLVGALVGAGAGFLGGKWLGDREVDNYKELEKTTEAAKYNSQEMKDAIMEGSASAEELQAIFQEACSDDMVKRFGDIELSMEEIEKYARKVTFGDQAKVMEKFASASGKASQSLETFHTAAEDMERLNFDMSEHRWKIKSGIDVKLNKEEIAEVKARVQTFMDSAEKALSDSHYEFNVAVDVLLQDGKTKEGILKTGDSLYQKLQKDLNSANKKLEAQYEIALKDGVITADEQKIISDYQAKVAEIIDKVSQADTEASFEIAKLKFTTGDLSAESFAGLQTSLNTQLEDYIGQQDVALQAAVSDIQLQMSEDPDNAEKYKQQIQELVNGYNANIESMTARVEKVQLEGISEAFDGAGTVEQLQGAISALTEEGKNPVDLTFKDINAHLEMSEDSLSEEEKANFTSVMKQALQSSMSGENALKPEADVQAKLTANEEALATETSVVRQTALDTLQNGFTDPLSVNGTANLALKWNITSGKSATVDINGSSKTLTASLTQKANGGLVDRPIEALIGEAGPEMIIPLSANRRQRGKALWERAGRAMGLWSGAIPNANGGLYGHGSSRLGDMLSSAKSASDTEQTQRPSGNGTVQVNVGGITMQVDSKDTADDIAGKIAKILEQAFQNIPVTVGT